jgi:CRISPR-associated endonuclease Cas2
MRRKWCLVSYDIRDDKRRARAARWLEARGLRVQHSVFLVPDLAEAALRDGLRRLLDVAVDELLVQPLCGACLKRAHRLGPGQDPTAPVRYRIL